jgi:hypothetical protein
MHGLVPVFCGLAVGAGFKSTWGYLLVDIPLVACTAFLGLAATRQLRQVRHQNH